MISLMLIEDLAAMVSAALHIINGSALALRGVTITRYLEIGGDTSEDVPQWSWQSSRRVKAGMH